MELLYWTDSLGRIELQMTLEDAESVSHQGRCDDDVSALRKMPYLATQLDNLKPEPVRAYLKEYGTWDADELADHDANLDRIVWLAGCDIREQAQERA
jgi:folate-binding Fe-S cluster repair protein YgfZ